MLELFVFSLYATVSFGLFTYGLNSYVMLVLFARVHNEILAKKNSSNVSDFLGSEDSLPTVTTQIPLYNEANVAERIIRSVAAIDYPREKHEIQILDDSTDKTRNIVDQLVEEFQSDGYNIKAFRRENRQGYKAGALQEGMDVCVGEYVAIFDSDFIPPSNFLKAAIPSFFNDDRLALVQGRWGHINADDSLLTRAQGIGIDGHFVVEQTARTFNGLFMNFNGTAGVWRKKAIYDAGGWESNTLTEDLDLSYRVQLKGWKMHYNPHLVVPAELPPTVSAFKSQQFRWAKGSIQTAKKIFPQVWKANLPLFKKWEAFIHLTHYMIHPLMFSVAILALPVLLFVDMKVSLWIFGLISTVMGFAVVAPSILYVISQKTIYKNWLVRIFYLPVLMSIGVGIAISNTKAVLEAFLGIESGFIRTPKTGDKLIKQYRIKSPWISFLEIAVGIYALVTLYLYWLDGNILITPFLLLYGSGFLHIGISGLIEEIKQSRIYFRNNRKASLGFNG